MSSSAVAEASGGIMAAIDPETISTAAVYAPVLCMVDYGIDEPERSCVTHFQGVQLGSIDVFRYEGVGVHGGDRRPEHVRADRLDDYLVTIPLHARINFDQAGQVHSMEPGHFALLSTRQPFTASISSLSGGETFSALHARVSGSALRQRMPHAEECCGLPMQLRAGAGVMLREMCQLAVREGRGLSAYEGHRFAGMLIDAVTNATVEAPETFALPVLASNWAYRRISRQAKTYIENHLADPTLDIDAVAAYCRVSKRYLQAVFADTGETVSATIRELRLQRCREALRNPAMRRYTIAQIATQWGFGDMPHFCRAYKTRFDASPGRDRELH